MTRVPLLHRPEPDDVLTPICGAVGGFTRVKATVKGGVVVGVEPPHWEACPKCEDLARQFGFGAAPVFDAKSARLLAQAKADEIREKGKKP